MDFDFSGITQAFNQVKNAVMNYTEYEIKVRDATNNDPWGASSTLMNEISLATWHFNHFSEIMTTIYKRLEDSSSGEWRKVYKALQLLEFLLKNGSDQVIDSVKTHSRDVGVLENFHYIDEKGKDQGINVRHRAKEILVLINDPTKLEQERAKAKENKSKYTGVSSTGLSFSSNHATQFSSQQSSNFSSFNQKKKSESTSEKELTSKKESLKKNKDPPPVQEVDLLNFDDAPAQVTKDVVDDWGEFTAASSKSPVPLSVEITNNNDDFGDFTSAAPSAGVNHKNSIFADFESFAPQSSGNTSNTLLQNTTENTPIEKKEYSQSADPYSKLVNLDSLMFTSKNTGPSLADLTRAKQEL
jgi:epsin